MNELRRLIVRHRHVAPLVAQLLAGTDAAVTIRDVDGEVILDRGGAEFGERFPITADADTIGWVDGGRSARVVAAVLSYAAARERDKRSLATEALERYRELSMIYDLADAIGGSEDSTAVGAAVVAQVERLPNGARGLVLLREQGGSLDPLAASAGVDVAGFRVPVGTGIVWAAFGQDASAELIDVPADDPRATVAERSGGSLIACSLRAGGRATGVLVAIAGPGRVFRSADLKVVTAIAALAGPVIEQARRHEATLLHRTGHDQPVPT